MQIENETAAQEIIDSQKERNKMMKKKVGKRFSVKQKIGS